MGSIGSPQPLLVVPRPPYAARQLPFPVALRSNAVPAMSPRRRQPCRGRHSAAAAGGARGSMASAVPDGGRCNVTSYGGARGPQWRPPAAVLTPAVTSRPFGGPVTSRSRPVPVPQAARAARREVAVQLQVVEAARRLASAPGLPPEQRRRRQRLQAEAAQRLRQLRAQLGEPGMGGGMVMGIRGGRGRGKGGGLGVMMGACSGRWGVSGRD